MSQQTNYDLVQHLYRQSAFSAKTFGPGARTKGVLDHIRKELLEIEKDPQDLSEWVDVILLGMDGAWRSGHTPEEIVKGLQDKLTKNENRTWPDWRTMDPDKAIEHDRSQDDIMPNGLTVSETENTASVMGLGSTTDIVFNKSVFKDCPRPNTTWTHASGSTYTVLGIANGFTEDPTRYPITVVYQGDNGRVWARLLKDWGRSMFPLTPGDDYASAD